MQIEAGQYYKLKKNVKDYPELLLVTDVDIDYVRYDDGEYGRSIKTSTFVELYVHEPLGKEKQQTKILELMKEISSIECDLQTEEFQLSNLNSALFLDDDSEKNNDNTNIISNNQLGIERVSELKKQLMHFRNSIIKKQHVVEEKHKKNEIEEEFVDLSYDDEEPTNSQLSDKEIQSDYEIINE